MNSKRTPEPALPKLSLAVQYASVAQHLPTRAQLRRWLKAALRRDAAMTLRIVDEATGTLCGDVVICAPVVEREAREQGKDLAAHYAHLAIHAALHLQGCDHENDADAAGMEALETGLMLELRFPDPYQDTYITNGRPRK